MTTTISTLAAELKSVHAVLEPIGAAYNEAVPGAANEPDLARAFRECSMRSQELVSAIVCQEPQSARDALSFALVILDYAVFDGDGAGVGCDGTRNHVNAARALVQYLAREASVTPAELGIFGEALVAAKLKDGPRATAN